MNLETLEIMGRNLLGDIAPDLSWYWIFQQAAEGELTHAYASPWPLYWMRQTLIDAGEWTGPASVIVFRRTPPTIEAGLATLIHEAGHLLPPRPMPPDIEPTGEQVQRQNEVFESWMKSEALPSDTPAPWYGHDERWIRRVVHLWFRSLLAGVSIPLDLLSCAGAFYGLSPIWRYVEALGSEPFKLQRYTFRDIEHETPPAEFTALFAGDVAMWNARKVEAQ